MRSFRAVVMITPPERSARPFWSGVSGGDGVKVMPFAAIISFHLVPKPFSPSDLMYRVVNPQFVFVIARNSLVTDTS